MNRQDTKTPLAPARNVLTPSRWLAVCVCLWLAIISPASAQENAGPSEYQVKAAYLCKFPAFTEWPASAFASPDAPLVIGVLGDDPFGKTLDELVKDGIVRGHPLVVRHLNASDDFKGCHVLFISHSEKDKVATVLQKIKASSILTVSDDPGFADQGGMVNFVLLQEKVKLEINPAAAEEAGLQISAKLLRLARIVKTN